MSSFTTGQYAAQARSVLDEYHRSRPPNTIKNYQRYAEEFHEFCEAKYPHDVFKQQITEEKVFIFLFYLAFRKKRSGKKRKVSDNEGVPTKRFDVREFNEIVHRSGDNLFVSMTQQEAEMECNEKVKYQALNTCWSALVDILRYQKSMVQNTLTVAELANSERIIALRKLVRDRKVTEDEKFCKEKVNHEVSPFLAINHLEPVENELFKMHATNSRLSTTSLRNRFTYLFTLMGILRGESVFKCKLSDFFTFSYRPKLEPHAYEVMAVKVTTGKVNKNRTLYGRIICHCKAEMCAYGAFGLYLLLRVSITDELKNGLPFEQKLG